MDVRQGVLERSGFKMLYLYNELAALRRQVSSAPPQIPANTSEGHASPLISALQRHNELINVFAICPLRAFVEATIDTRELWKRKEAGVAFEIMGSATAGLLPKFDFKPQDAVKVALVNREGKISWDEQF
jgi:hypothetical protein